MRGFLLDTNIPSEMTRPRPSPRVEQWLNDVVDEQLFISVISLAEIIRGVTRQADLNRQLQLQSWLDGTLRPWFAGRVLPVNQQIAERLGKLAGERDSKGRTLPFGDGLIAATALEHDLALVTRNVRDFADLGLTIINPWEEL